MDLSSYLSDEFDTDDGASTRCSSPPGSPPHDMVTVTPNRYQKRLKKIRKKGPDSLIGFREREAERVRRYRLTLSEEKRKTANEKSKLRQRTYNARQKEAETNVPAKHLTRKEMEKQEQEKLGLRKYWRDKRRESRTRYKLKQAENACNECDTIEDLNIEEHDDNDDDASIQSISSPEKPSSSTRVAVHRLQKKLPKYASAWVRLLGGVVKSASPAKKEKLCKKAPLRSPTSAKSCESYGAVFRETF